MAAAPAIIPTIPWQLSAAVEHLHRDVILGFLVTHPGTAREPSELPERTVALGATDLHLGITLANDQRCLVVDDQDAPLNPSRELVSTLKRLTRQCAGVGVLTPRVPVLLQVADRVVVCGPAGCLAFLNPDAVRHSAVLEVAVDPLRLATLATLTDRWPDLVVEHGTLHIPLLDRTPEDILAECRAVGLEVDGTRVHYPLLEPLTVLG